MQRINKMAVWAWGLSVIIILAGSIPGAWAATKEEKQAEKDAKKQAAKEAKQAKLKAAGLETITNPPKIKFGEFKQVELKGTTLAAKHAQHKGNQESALRIDDLLSAQLKTQFPNLKQIAATVEFSKPAERTLQVAPQIVEIRLISVGSRVWAGPMAGGSHLLVKVTFKDSHTSEIIADPQFFVSSDAWAGAGTIGAMDNQIRDRVVQEIAAYVNQNH
jgi:hypothetical protein